jgi:hypothetical protein
MGKRSDFERIPRDFYPTPFAAVPPLIPHLRGVRTFAEPCCGNGALVRHLESHGLRCVYQGDIATGQDALATTDYGAPDMIITNPPHTRGPMHAMILASIAPAWLLLDQNWVATLQAVPYLSCCSDIVIIGRVKWVAGSKNAGKDNFAWYRFDARHRGVTAIHRRGEAPARHTQVCEHCRKPYESQRSSSRFCSDTCRQRAHRQLSVHKRDTGLT